MRPRCVEEQFISFIAQLRARFLANVAEGIEIPPSSNGSKVQMKITKAGTQFCVKLSALQLVDVHVRLI